MSHTIETKGLWSLLHRAREEKNKPAEYCAHRALTSANRGQSRNSSAWERLAIFELANPEKPVAMAELESMGSDEGVAA